MSRDRAPTRIQKIERGICQDPPGTKRVLKKLVKRAERRAAKRDPETIHRRRYCW